MDHSHQNDISQPHDNSGVQLPAFSFPNTQYDQAYPAGTFVPNIQTYPGLPSQMALGFDSFLPPTNNVAPSIVPYQFQSTNWLEEHLQSFPAQTSPDLQGPSEQDAEQPLPGVTGIGFEHFWGLESDEPTTHYHSINIQFNGNRQRDGVFSAGEDFTQVSRRHTIHIAPDSNNFFFQTQTTNTNEITQRSRSLYGYSAHQSLDLEEPPTASHHSWKSEKQEWRIKLLDSSENSNKDFGAFCDAVKTIRREYSASDPVSNSGRVWSVAVRFPLGVSVESDLNITVYGDCLPHPLNYSEKDCVHVQDFISRMIQHNYSVMQHPNNPAPQYPDSPAPQYPNSHAPQYSNSHAPQYPNSPAPQYSNSHAPQYPNSPAPQYPNSPAPQYPNSHAPQYPNSPAPQYSNSHAPQYPNSHAPQYSNSHAPQYPNSHAPQYPNSHAPQYPNSPAPQYYNSPAPQYSNSPAPQYPNSPAPQHPNSHVSQYSNSPAPLHPNYPVLQQCQYPSLQGIYPPLQPQVSLSHPQDPPGQHLYPSLHSVSQQEYRLAQNDHPPAQPTYHSAPQQLYPSPPYCASPSQYPPAPPQGYLVSICGFDEFLQNDFTFRCHTKLQRLTSVQLRLHLRPQPLLCRTEEDQSDWQLDLSEHGQYWTQMKSRLTNAVSHYGDQALSFLNNKVYVTHVLEAVREICYLLRGVETKELSTALNALRHSQYLMANQGGTSQVSQQSVVLGVSRALAHLISIYSSSFNADFLVEIPRSPRCRTESPDSHLSFHLYSAHNLPDNWVNRISTFSLSCSVIYAGRKLCPEMKSRGAQATHSMFSLVTWDEVITFPLPVCVLPYESILVLRLSGLDNGSNKTANLAWSCLPLYSHGRFARGAMLLNMISHAEPPPVITPGAIDKTLPTLVTVQVELPEINQTFSQPAPEQIAGNVPSEDPSGFLEILVHRNSVLLLSEADKQYLWNYRSCCKKPRNILPLVLGSAPGWDPSIISAMYRVLGDWTFSHPLEGLGLLNSSFSDQRIRETSCLEIGKLPNDELLDFLPQLVQAVKFEWSLDSPLVKLLLHRSLQSIQVAHRLFWLLTDAHKESHYRGLYSKVLAALQSCAGNALNGEFCTQKRLISILQGIAEKVKTSPDTKRQETLQSNLHQLQRFFQEAQLCRLPLDPAVRVRGIDPNACSFFKSNASPLKISFLNADPLGKKINVIFKLGDDLRQDMLVLQIIEVIDRIWLHEGLDLRMITYKCLSTGLNQGLVQMVPDATTLAKIHEHSGILGPLKDKSIKKWFKSKQPLQHNYEKAKENFLFSCAGWCVVTFILGVCDRHNDNIMVTNTGHMFHIDFGKFLGHAQKFGSIKRDRAPFIFTSEMEYFITDGGKNLDRARDFVELCCQAYNILRKHSHLLINMLELMLQGGLPELCGVEDLRYLQNNLRPQDSEPEATSYFTRKISESLQCFPVKLNNLIHILANTSLSDMAKSVSQIDLMDPAGGNPKNLIKRAAIASIRKINKKSEKVLNYLGAEGRTGAASSSGDTDVRPAVQLHVSYKNQTLSVLIKHLRNIHLPDGSSPCTEIEVLLLPDPQQTSLRRVKSTGKSALIYNEIVRYSLLPLVAGYVIRLVVRSKGQLIAAVNVPVDHMQFDSDVWYPMGLSLA
ncbi:phosphatidylinositol 4-phosphate 3-kinase C2 domain-containing subunit gamma isoform X2 [Xenopus laevis]|uniref:Phosphatidylinositol 4-phosphate 3-kinase C2 domain-containing subunit gamma isoform X2 n=1 Tax=Xenopus laevis TaxID=8355 RepID=A0A8J0UNE5_XENLA|nr:phosphatidylinositol 4-phosphate 3-kinase C2 domain-containing subunit gamma isoform X2 [Xenopus laevis]